LAVLLICEAHCTTMFLVVALIVREYE